MGLTTNWVPDDGPSPVWVDFNRGGRDSVYLDLPATRADLQRHGIELREGLALNVWDEDTNDAGERDDTLASGIVERDTTRGTWRLRIKQGRHESDSHWTPSSER